MKSFRPTRVSVSSQAQEDSANGVGLIYSGCRLVIPEDGIWQLFGIGTMTSTNIADAKRMALYNAATGALLPESGSPEGDPAATGVFVAYTTEWTGRLRRGDVIQLYGQQNGSSIIRMGNASVPLVGVNRIRAVRIG